MVGQKIFGIKEKAVTNLLTILKQNIPDIQWPLRISNAGNYLNSIKSYFVLSNEPNYKLYCKTR